MICVVLFLLWACAASAQITDLAVTDDGAQLYFSSPLRQKGSDQYTHMKLFRVVETGATELFQQIERRYPEGGPNTSNFYAAVGTSVSGDGTIVGYSLNRECVGGSGCVFVERNRSVVIGRGLTQPMDFNGRVQVSGNGRYVLQYGGLDVFPITSLTDLSTGHRTERPGRETGIIGRQALTDDGRFLARDNEGLMLWSANGVRRIATSERATSAIVDRYASVLIYRTEASVLRARNLSSSAEVPIATGSDPVLSWDGRWLLYLAPDDASVLPQVWLARTDGSEKRRLTELREDILCATLTGYANAAFLSTDSGRLLRIDLPSGQTRELVPRTPSLDEVTGAPAAGSLNWLRGSGFTGTTTVTLDGMSVPLLSVAPTQIVYQIPWDAPERLLRLALEPDTSPFESAPLSIDAAYTDPQFVSYGREISPPPPGTDSGAVVVHQDFGSLVTLANMARPGEIVHLYMTGLGPVVPAVPSGEPAPLDRLTSLQEPLHCRWMEDGRTSPAELLFAGLAPGMIGIYQVSVRLPENPLPLSTDPSRAIATLQCGDPTQFESSAEIHVRLQ